MPYQVKWLQAATKHRVMVWEKSRRIGATWADAALSTLDAASANGSDTYYVSTNREATLDYIESIAFWAKSYQLAASAVEQIILKDEDEDVLAFRVRFASGYKVVALSSRPSNFRGKQGNVVIDECAFLQNLDECRKAAMALLMWGGQIRFISTHNGVKNPFNQLCLDIRSGKQKYYLQTTTLKDAIADGLYQRISLVTGTQWTLEGEFAFVTGLYEDYGIGADEELGCVPLDVVGGGLVFNRDWFEIIDVIPSHFDAQVRFWDLAATTGKKSYYTAGIRLAKSGDLYYVTDALADKLGPVAGDDLMVETMMLDGRDIPIRWEMEGGSDGLKYEAYMQTKMAGADAKAVRPSGDKLTRAKPIAGEAKAGRVKIIKSHWNNMFLDAVHGFDGQPRPLINDITDALSGAHAHIVSTQPINFGIANRRNRYDNSYGGMAGNWRDHL